MQNITARLNSKLLLSASVITASVALVIGAAFAFFSDTETSIDNIFAAGEVDLGIDNHSFYNGVLNPGTTWRVDYDLSDNPPRQFFNFLDVKPGDWGEDTISLHVKNNDAWLCADVTLTSNDENDLIEPELVDGDDTTGNSGGELAQNITFFWWADDGDNVFEEDETEMKEKKFWIMRRESFSLLRQKVKDKHTAPFIDDLVVNPEHLPEFLPKLRVIIKKYGLLATVAGHMGDGNFHIIPLMKLEEPSERRKLLPCMQEVNELILSYGGSLSGEHNDGLVRGPWLKDQFGEEILKLFKETKDIFDPNHIFNPHKKANSTWEYSQKHIRASF